MGEAALRVAVYAQATLDMTQRRAAPTLRRSSGLLNRTGRAGEVELPCMEMPCADGNYGIVAV
jgi:hypothetical protein